MQWTLSLSPSFSIPPSLLPFPPFLLSVSLPYFIPHTLPFLLFHSTSPIIRPFLLRPSDRLQERAGGRGKEKEGTRYVNGFTFFFSTAVAMNIHLRLNESRRKCGKTLFYSASVFLPTAGWVATDQQTGWGTLEGRQPGRWRRGRPTTPEAHKAAKTSTTIRYFGWRWRQVFHALMILLRTHRAAADHSLWCWRQVLFALMILLVIRLSGSAYHTAWGAARWVTGRLLTAVPQPPSPGWPPPLLSVVPVFP